jgi:anti-anti-sigma factor
VPEEQDGGIKVITMAAEIDLDSAAQVCAMLTQALDGVTVLVADMALTTRCTLEGVQALLQARAAAARAGVQLRLAAASPAIWRVLERNGTSQFLAVYPSLDAAQADPA